MPATVTHTQTPVIVLVERDCAGSHDPALRGIADVASRSRVHLVVPARPVAGERWLIDVAAREQDAHERLESWTTALAALAIRVDGQIGDANQRLAVADARRELGHELVLLTVSDSTHSPAVAAARPARPTRRMAVRALAA